MLDLILNSYARNQSLAHRLLADVADEDLCAQPSPGMNHPAWILGRLAWASDVGCLLMGLPTGLRDGWADQYDFRSRPEPDRSRYPDQATLTRVYEDIHARFAAALPGVPAEALARPLPNERQRKLLPTIGDALVHLATAHESFHIGQLSAWRRARGSSPIALF
jgi:uncharacterized damage-inducible protein DinB